MSIIYRTVLYVDVLGTDVADAEKELWALIEAADSLSDIKKSCAAYSVDQIEAEAKKDDTD